MKIYAIKKTKGKGKGLFANRHLLKGEKILHSDMSKLKKYSKNEAYSNKELQVGQLDYVGRGKYVISNQILNFVNHSCEPNCYLIAFSDDYITIAQ